MAWCEVKDVRNSNYKLSSVKDVSKISIEEKITEAQKIVIVDLSDIISKEELESIGENSSAINLLTIYKAVEKILVALYGASRQVDEVSDIQYFQNQYNYLLEKVISGGVKIIDETGENLSPKETPKLAPSKRNNIKLYPRKGIPDFIPPGADQAYKDN